MKNIGKKLSAAVLSFLLLAVLFAGVSCGDESAPASDTTADASVSVPEEDITTDYYDALDKSLDFGGYEFNVISYKSETWDIYIAPESENGEVLNDSAFRRNLEVEDLLNIKIKTTIGDDYEKKFQNMVLSGADDFDLICFWSPGERSGYVSQHLAFDWKQLPYVNLESEWYNQTANAAYSIGSRQYFAVSDFTYTVQQHFRIVSNKDLIKDIGKEQPYQDVFDGTWTFDKMLWYCAGVYSDLDGDQQAGLGDRYGLVLNAAFSAAFPFNAGEIQVTNSDDGFVVNLYSDRIANIVESIVALRANTDVYFNKKQNNDQYKIFDDGNALFKPYGSDPALLRLHEFDIGYLPYPKYDEAQPDYVVWSAGGMMAVPQSVSDIDRTGAIIEALSAASNKYVKDAFVEQYVENKILRDEESTQIYRMMRDKATYDLSYNLDPSGKLSGYAYYSYFMTKNNADAASYYASIKEKVETGYAQLFEEATGE